MDIVLDENDVKRLVLTALGMSASVDSVQLKLKPFRLHITSAEKFLTASPSQPDLPRKYPDSNTDEVASASASVLGFEELLRANEELVREPTTAAKGPRRLRAQEQQEPPPPSSVDGGYER